MSTVKGYDKSSKSILSWCAYDWANSAFATVIITFIFSVYFSRGIVGDETAGSAMWGYAIALSGIVIAILGPILGAVADHSGARKRWVLAFSLLCIVPTALLYFGGPSDDMHNIIFVLALVVIANIGFELAQVFYNAMLPHIAPAEKIGRVSGWAWGLGYAGGLSCLALTLFGLIGIGDIEPFFPISGQDSANVRASGPLAALWFAIFMIPLLLWTKDSEVVPLGIGDSLRNGLAQLAGTLKEIKQHGNLVLFLVASALYRDGLVTLFAIGGVYAGGQLGMNFQEVIYFAIALNVTAGLGAFCFAHLDDKIGSRTTAMLSLMGLIITGVIILFITDKWVFIGVSMVLGIFIGPVQAASRTLAARLSPEGMITQTYGFYAFTGKSVAFLGPLAYATMVSMTDSQLMGMLSIIWFWVIGLVLLAFVKER